MMDFWWIINNRDKNDIICSMESQMQRFWTRDSSILLGGFFAAIFLIVYIWWPLAEEYLGQIDPAYPVWAQVDWLLIGIFLAMSILIMMGADLRTDAWIVLVATVGGLTIEAWGTQTLLWTYYTSERPPLWIVPAWPIATLAIDRITRMLNALTRRVPDVWWERLFLSVLGAFFLLMIYFTRRTLEAVYPGGAAAVRADHPLARRETQRPADFPGRRRVGIFSRTVGDHARVLDLLHPRNAAGVCGPGPWNGVACVLADRSASARSFSETDGDAQQAHPPGTAYF